MSEYISLDEAKEQCSVELADTAHDARLTRLILAAQTAAQNFLNRPLSELEDADISSPATLPADLRAAILMQVEFLFDRDERTADMLNKAVENLLWPYRTGLEV